MSNLFFELLQVAVSQRVELSSVPTEEEWEELFQMAKKQSVLGICFQGIENLRKDQCPQRRMIMRWVANSDKVEQKNENTLEGCVKIVNLFRKHGYRSCILKGQGIASYYPHPERRTSGDIDIWVEGGREKVLKYIRPLFPKRKVIYHHMDFPVMKGLPVEVHFTPTWMNNPFKNRYLQRWFLEKPDEQFSHETELGFCIPTPQFNTIFILIHIYRHLFDEGIGLRQLLDYYYVLKLFHKNNSIPKNQIMEVFHHLGMEKFVGATMYVLQQVFSMPAEWMLCEPLEKRGEFLLQEIMLSGNFGKFDLRSQKRKGESKPHRLVRRLGRNLRFLRQYPDEILWFPIFTSVHWIWRKWKGYV